MTGHLRSMVCVCVKSLLIHVCQYVHCENSEYDYGCPRSSDDQHTCANWVCFYAVRFKGSSAALLCIATHRTFFCKHRHNNIQICREYIQRMTKSGTVRALLRTSSMIHRKRVYMRLTSPGAGVQPLALEPMALETPAADTSSV